MYQIINNFIGNTLIVLGAIFFCGIILKKVKEITTKKNIVVLMIGAICYTIIMIYFKGTLKTLLMMCTLFGVNKYIFKDNLKKTVFLITLYTLILLIVDLFILLFMTEVLSISKEFYYSEFAGSIIANAIVIVLIIIITILIKKILRKIINTNIETNVKIIIYSILILICSTMFLYTTVREFRFSNNILLYLVSIIVLVTVLFSLIKQTIENNKLTNEYDKILEFMTTYENEVENQRILRHEIKNEFRTIRAKLSDNQENKEIIEYIDEIVKDKYEINKEKYAKFGHLPPNGIKGLCYFKAQEAEEKGLKISINISKRIKGTSIYNLNIKEQRDFGRIIGVFLDNAIEASIESEEKQLGIEAYSSKENDCKIIITNTFQNNIEMVKIGKERFSTKGKNRGHGLLLVKQLVDKNKIFTTKTEIQGNLYIQTIEIKKL